MVAALRGRHNKGTMGGGKGCHFATPHPHNVTGGGILHRGGFTPWEWGNWSALRGGCPLLWGNFGVLRGEFLPPPPTGGCLGIWSVGGGFCPRLGVFWSAGGALPTPLPRQVFGALGGGKQEVPPPIIIGRGTSAPHPPSVFGSVDGGVFAPHSPSPKEFFVHYWEGGKGRRYPWSVPWQLGGGGEESQWLGPVAGCAAVLQGRGKLMGGAPPDPPWDLPSSPPHPPPQIVPMPPQAPT